jgi:hypothetical protein
LDPALEELTRKSLLSKSVVDCKIREQAARAALVELAEQKAHHDSPLRTGELRTGHEGVQHRLRRTAVAPEARRPISRIFVLVRIGEVRKKQLAIELVEEYVVAVLAEVDDFSLSLCH